MKKEIYWLAGTLVLVIVLHLFHFGWEGFQPDTQFDLQVFDSYFAMSSLYFLWPFAVTCFFLVYLVKVMAMAFSSGPANLILMIASIFLFLFTTRGGLIMGGVLQGESLVNFATAMVVVQLVLLVLLAYTAFRTGNLKKYGS
ncbi:hypothetical protein DN752_11805 [Echinicola strongylocentroti]|uniref:Uncharacterized protein n=1 Tax=Echinicola strongylocentroti TaxID=1795355 RepID=A0A2Z4II05_9BACT|nr:hypothetical protein [Echinicola strongylocentroti]AWW30752.1 hypothetical protein DN752_11805 [Echinicola strongylocentroti]